MPHTTPPSLLSHFLGARGGRGWSGRGGAADIGDDPLGAFAQGQGLRVGPVAPEKTPSRPSIGPPIATHGRIITPRPLLKRQMGAWAARRAPGGPRKRVLAQLQSDENQPPSRHPRRQPVWTPNASRFKWVPFSHEPSPRDVNAVPGGPGLRRKIGRGVASEKKGGALVGVSDRLARRAGPGAIESARALRWGDSDTHAPQAEGRVDTQVSRGRHPAPLGTLRRPALASPLSLLGEGF